MSKRAFALKDIWMKSIEQIHWDDKTPIEYALKKGYWKQEEQIEICYFTSSSIIFT